MTLTVIAGFQAKPGAEDDLRTALEAMIEPSLEEAGCLAYEPYTDPNQPARMVLIEEWTSKQALDLHFATPHFAHVASVLDALLVEPFTIKHLIDAETK